MVGQRLVGLVFTVCPKLEAIGGTFFHVLDLRTAKKVSVVIL